MPNQVAIRIDAFEKEAQDYGINNFTEFYNNLVFKAKNRIVDKNIVCSLN